MTFQVLGVLRRGEAISKYILYLKDLLNGDIGFDRLQSGLSLLLSVSIYLFMQDITEIMSLKSVSFTLNLLNDQGKLTQIVC
jgi:hypothetical protein